MLGGRRRCFCPFSLSLLGWKHLIMVLIFSQRPFLEPPCLPDISEHTNQSKAGCAFVLSLDGYLRSGSSRSIWIQKTLQCVGDCSGEREVPPPVSWL